MNIATMRIAMPWRGRRRRAAVIGLVGALALAGCSTFSQDGGFDAVARTAHERLGKEVRWARTPEEQAVIDRQVVQLLQRPLSVDDAVQIALLNNGALQASFQQLGISEADLVQSGRLPNPRFTLRRSSADGQYDIEETISMNVLSLLTVPYAHDIEKRRFAEVQSAAVLEVVQLADRTREAYFMALAARESTRYRQQVQAAAEAGAELARRMRAAGNWNRLDEAHEQGFYVDAALELSRAQLAENVARDNLTQVLGVAGDASKFQLAERLPDLPPKVEELPNVEQTALQTRIDLQMMRTRIDALARLPEIVSSGDARMQPPLQPPNGRPYRPVATLNGWTLPWCMHNGIKEFHLVAEPVIREIAPGMRANLWGYNGQSPGPTIEVVEGDRVRMFVTNRLPEATSIHWHGQRLPNGMDGVAGLNQPSIKRGQTFVYEFRAQRSGTFMYHPHADETTQMAMGMMGTWVTHPKDPAFMRVDRDYVLLLNAYDISPGSYTPKVSTMLDFNLWTFNSRAFPGIDPMVARLGERVRIRVGNLTMTNHPIHLHGHEFVVVGTDGGWTPVGSRWPEVTTDIAVGQMRAIEFTAAAPGDWAFHCHKGHHTMNAMAHAVPNTIGVEQADLAAKISSLVPNYMDAGAGGAMDGMQMQMPLPENTLPMMWGDGPYGSIEMGGMFTMVKIRPDLMHNDYRDPGWYKAPEDGVAYLWQGEAPPISRQP